MRAGPRGLAHLDERRLLASSVLGRLWKKLRVQAGFSPGRSVYLCVSIMNDVT